MKQWKFHVRGTLTRTQTTNEDSRFQVIVESGVRDEDSPHSLAGVGPIAIANADGVFESWYFTKGAESPATCPGCVSVFVRIKHGVWRPYVVPVKSSQRVKENDDELLLELDAAQVLFPPAFAR